MVRVGDVFKATPDVYYIVTVTGRGLCSLTNMDTGEGVLRTWLDITRLKYVLVARNYTFKR